MLQPNGQPSRLVKQIRMHPFSVVLLDEIEKASSDVFDALLGVLDEGRLTDAFGRTATFRSSVIIMTSNLGASRSANVGFESTPPNYLKAVEDAFRPEFFNRIDHLFTFLRIATEWFFTKDHLSGFRSSDGDVGGCQ